MVSKGGGLGPSGYILYQCRSPECQFRSGQALLPLSLRLVSCPRQPSELLLLFGHGLSLGSLDFRTQLFSLGPHD